MATRSLASASVIRAPSWRHAPGTARAPGQPPWTFARGTRAGYASRGMPSLRRADLDAVFLDAGNTLITLDHALVCSVLAAEGLCVTPENLRRAEAAARPAVSRLLGGGVSSERSDTFTFYVGRILDQLGVAAPESAELAARVVTALRRDVGTQRL